MDLRVRIVALAEGRPFITVWQCRGNRVGRPVLETSRNLVELCVCEAVKSKVRIGSEILLCHAIYAMGVGTALVEATTDVEEIELNASF